MITLTDEQFREIQKALTDAITDAYDSRERDGKIDPEITSQTLRALTKAKALLYAAEMRRDFKDPITHG